MTRKLITIGVSLMALGLCPAYGDVMPVAGSTSGTFSNATGGGSSASGNTWTYHGNTQGYVDFTGTSFSGNTPSQFKFGSITLHNLINGGTGTFTADLSVTLTFTTPSGQTVTLGPDGLQLVAQGGNNQYDSLSLSFGGFPGAQNFSLGGETYTVSYDGFYDSTDSPLTSLSVQNGAAVKTATAYLKGTITASPTGPPLTSVSAVPEPGSILLFSTVLIGVAVTVRRKKVV